MTSKKKKKTPHVGLCHQSDENQRLANSLTFVK